MGIDRLTDLRNFYTDINALIQEPTSSPQEFDTKLMNLRRYLQNQSQSIAHGMVAHRAEYSEALNNIRRLGDVPAITHQIGVIHQQAAVYKLGSLLNERAGNEEISAWISENEKALSTPAQLLDIDPLAFFRDLQQARVQLGDALTPDEGRALAHFAVWGLQLKNTYDEVNAQLDMYFPGEPDAKAKALAYWVSDKKIHFSKVLEWGVTHEEMEGMVPHLQWLDCRGIGLPGEMLSLFTNAYDIVNVHSEDLANLSELSSKLETLTLNDCPNLQTADFTRFPFLKEVVIQSCPLDSVDLSNKEHLEKVALVDLPVKNINVTGSEEISEFHGIKLPNLERIEGAALPKCWTFDLRECPPGVPRPVLPTIPRPSGPLDR